MPDEIEIETKDLQETIDELREEREERTKEAQQTRWTRFISLSTAIFAVVAAIAALQAGKLVNEAVIQKGDAVLQQSKASDTWAYYQAKGIKAETASQTSDVLAASAGNAKSAAHWKSEAARQKAGQAELKKAAEELEAKRDEKNQEASGMLDKHEIFAQCVTCLQVAISLSAIAALTKRKDVWYSSILLGILGTALFTYGFLHHSDTKVKEPVAATSEKATTPPGEKSASGAEEHKSHLPEEGGKPPAGEGSGK